MAKDRFGYYEITSGNEGSGKCWWCGGEFPDKRVRRYCCEDCSKEYGRHYFWIFAVPWALERAGHKCFSCGSSGVLDVHHNAALNGEPRHFNAKNRPENLIVLCRSCHRKLHGRKAKLPRYELAKDIRQLSLFEVT